MITPEIAVVCRLGFALIGLWMLYWFCYRPSFLDAYRQDLFAIRDRLFDAASRIPGAFADPGYQAQRRLINGYIRFAHATGPVAILTVWLIQVLCGRRLEASEEARPAN